MTTVYYISHPDVIIDPHISIPQWDLSPLGRQKLEKLLTQPWLETIRSIYCSDEHKARSAAGRIAQQLGLGTQIVPELGEIDRSATGYLERAELEPVVEAFYAHPAQSIRGWERAIDAQQRTILAVSRIVSQTLPESPIAIVGHGGVGTLLLNYLKNVAISRADAPPGQGYYYAFIWETRLLLHPWKAIDQADGM